MTHPTPPRRRKTDDLLSLDERQWHEGYRHGLEDAEAILMRHFGNDWNGNQALAEIRKLRKST